jgi:hypothetical protein
MINHDNAMITGTAMSKCSTLLYKVPLPPQVLNEEKCESAGPWKELKAEHTTKLTVPSQLGCRTKAALVSWICIAAKRTSAAWNTGPAGVMSPHNTSQSSKRETHIKCQQAGSHFVNGGHQRPSTTQTVCPRHQTQRD